MKCAPGVEAGREVPWDRYQWSGEFRALEEGVDTSDFKEEDVEELIAYADTGDGWDGTAVGICKLKDGRYVSWESTWGPTGSGFSHDAYGGDADICFANSLEKALRGISGNYMYLIGDMLPDHVHAAIRLGGWEAAREMVGDGE